ncbi:hypothetical protein BGX24_005482 [Mortierella sp. AD032]|nr:hypothetical protein BGX24_005482 [Mortierella sp. AD032]
MDFAKSELVQRQPVQNTTGVFIETDPALDTSIPTAIYGEYEGRNNDDDGLADGMTTPTRRSNSSIGSPSTSDDLDIQFCTPPPMPAFTHPPPPPRPAEYHRPLEDISRRLQPSRLSESSVNPTRADRTGYGTSAATVWALNSDSQPFNYKRWFRGQLPASSTTDGPPPDGMISRKPLTSIAGSNRCLWPPDSTFLTMSSATSREPSFQNHDRGFNQLSSNGGATCSSSSSLAGGATSSLTTLVTPQKNHNCSDSFKDSGECLLDLQHRRKARRTIAESPYFKERNDRMVASHVQKLIQEAVEDGVGELDLSNLELTDLPPEVRDLNFAIVYNERGSFSLSRNRLKLFLSSNQFTTVPMHVFELHNLSVLSLRNNNIKAIPPEIGLLYNLVELSIGGNLLEHLPSQITLLPKLHILTIHPNPFMTCPEPEGGTSELDPAEQQQQQQQQQDLIGNGIEDIGTQLDDQQEEQQYLAEDYSVISSELPISQINEDIEMSLAQEQDSQDVPSLNGDGVSADQVYVEQGAVHPQSIAPRTREQMPLHKVMRSRFPTLAHLAGNAILNYVDSQMTTAGDNDTDRPRKDSKISMDDDDWIENSKEYRDVTTWAGGCGGKEATGTRKGRVVFKEDVLKDYMTPYLFDIFKRAQINNRCAGCHRRFWKPCRIVIVWQDVLGQRQVPIRWKGCGIGTCPGVPEALWPSARHSSDRSPVLSVDPTGRASHADGSPSSSSGAARMIAAS